jgi:hypothetical protein
MSSKSPNNAKQDKQKRKQIKQTVFQTHIKTPRRTEIAKITELVRVRAGGSLGPPNSGSVSFIQP